MDYASQEIHYIEQQVHDSLGGAVVQQQDSHKIQRNENRSMQEHRHDILIQTNITLVTAYFQLKSKYSDDTYDKWMSHMLSMKDAMVIFTSPDFVSNILKHRQHALNKTVVISMPLEHVPMAQEFTQEFWKAQHDMDPEKRLHQNYPLFWIWLSKSWFVYEAVERNYFGSHIFMYTDIGSFRKEKFRDIRLMRHPALVPRHSILFMAHHTPNPPPTKLWNDKIKQKQHFYQSGSQAIGYADTWRDFHAAFLTTIQQFVLQEMFLGEDQAVLQSTCLLHPNLCAYIPFTQVPDNHYFGLRYVLRHGGKYTYWRPPGATLENEVFSS